MSIQKIIASEWGKVGSAGLLALFSDSLSFLQASVQIESLRVTWQYARSGEYACNGKGRRQSQSKSGEQGRSLRGTRDFLFGFAGESADEIL
jgi:hypothetical protein